MLNSLEKLIQILSLDRKYFTVLNLYVIKLPCSIYRVHYTHSVVSGIYTRQKTKVTQNDIVPMYICSVGFP